MSFPFILVLSSYLFLQLGIERWTDGIRWGPSRVRDEFLFYHEKDAAPTEDIASDSDSSVVSPLRNRSPFLNSYFDLDPNPMQDPATLAVY